MQRKERRQKKMTEDTSPCHHCHHQLTRYFCHVIISKNNGIEYQITCNTRYSNT